MGLNCFHAPCTGCEVAALEADESRAKGLARTVDAFCKHQGLKALAYDDHGLTHKIDEMDHSGDFGTSGWLVDKPEDLQAVKGSINRRLEGNCPPSET